MSSSTSSLLMQYVFSGLSATASELVTYPLDLTKTRLQIQGEHGVLQGAPSRGMLGTAVGICREEGVLHLWRGLHAAILRQIVYSGARMIIYEQLRDKVLGRESDGSYPLYKSMLGGAVCGAAGQWLASPTDLVKVQIQMEGRRRLMGLEPRVRGLWQAFTSVASRGGLAALWAGSLPNCQRGAIINLADLATYDQAKQFLLQKMNLKDNILTHFIASMVSGLVQTVVSTPVDVVKSRIMNQPTDERGRGVLYKGSIDCFVTTVRSEGLLAMYKGFMPLWIRLGPWTLTFWVCYENLRKMAGIEGF